MYLVYIPTSCPFIAAALHASVERGDAAVRVLYGRTLLLDRVADCGWNHPVERIFVRPLRRLLAPLGLSDNRVIVMAGDESHEVHPPSVKGANAGAIRLGIASQPLRVRQ
jgi:hypothetical protein